MEINIENQICQLLGKAAEIEASGPLTEHDVSKTPWAGLDRITGIGGIPKRYAVEITGEPYSGKSVLAWHLASIVPSEEIVIADIDRGIDPHYIKAIGIDPSTVTLLRDNSMSTLLCIVETALNAGARAILIDTMSALLEAGKLTLSDINNLCSMCLSYDTLLLIVNQKRFQLHTSKKLESMYREYMDKVSPLCLEIVNRGYIEHWGTVVGHKADISITRNKMNNICSTLKMFLRYGKGLEYDSSS